MRKTRERERERERERRRRRPTRARESERRERPTLCVWGFRVSRFVTRASTARGRVVCERHTFSGEFPSVSTDLRVLCADRGRVHAAQLDLGRARADARLLPRQRRDALTVPGASSLSRLNRIFSYLFVSFSLLFSYLPAYLFVSFPRSDSNDVCASPIIPRGTRESSGALEKSQSLDTHSRSRLAQVMVMLLQSFVKSLTIALALCETVGTSRWRFEFG